MEQALENTYPSLTCWERFRLFPLNADLQAVEGSEMAAEIAEIFHDDRKISEAIIVKSHPAFQIEWWKSRGRRSGREKTRGTQGG